MEKRKQAHRGKEEKEVRLGAGQQGWEMGDAHKQTPLKVFLLLLGSEKNHI